MKLLGLLVQDYINLAQFGDILAPFCGELAHVHTHSELSLHVTHSIKLFMCTVSLTQNSGKPSLIIVFILKMKTDVWMS